MVSENDIKVLLSFWSVTFLFSLHSWVVVMLLTLRVGLMVHQYLSGNRDLQLAVQWSEKPLHEHCEGHSLNPVEGSVFFWLVFAFAPCNCCRESS